MVNENKTPILLDLLFGDAADMAWRGASARLMRWAEAFDRWLAERAQKVKPGTLRDAQLAWKRLLQESGRMPWELTQADIEAHAAWMEAQGYGSSAICKAVGYIAMFYRWCGERGIDPGYEPGFNPAAGVKRPRVRRYANAQLLSRGEIAALLGIIAKDETVLGLREYAFTLFRLRTGVKMKDLQHLQWGQLQHDQAGTAVSWGEEAEPWPLPGEVWEAVRAYLEASGRLAGILGETPEFPLLDEHYIFAPLAQPGMVGSKDRAGDWVAGRHLSNRQIRRSLKLYGRRAAIPEAKLNLHVLRFTAIRLYLDRGGSLDQIKTFTHSQDDRFQRSWLANLPELPENGERALFEAEAPDRAAKPFQPGDGLTHGFRAQGLPKDEVQAMLAEEVQGLAEEIVGMERLLDRLEVWKKVPSATSAGQATEWELRDKALSLMEEMQLLDTHTLAASWLAELRDAEERLLKEVDVNPWVEEILQMMDRLGVYKGDPLFGEKVRAEVFGAKPELDRRAEQIASMRCSLRRTLKLAAGAEGISDYLRLLVIYGRGCVRLKRILIKEAEAPSRAEEYIRQELREAIEELRQEWRPRNGSSGMQPGS